MMPLRFIISLALFVVLILPATTTNEPCGGIFTDSGVILSPGYPITYPNNANCKWILNANTTGNGISLRFSTFRTEAIFDIVLINDDRKQLRYGGTNEFIPTLNLGRRVIVEFSSDSFNTDIGFKATFTTVFRNRTCGSILTGAGSISTPNYPAKYSRNTTCQWTLLANPKGANVRLQFLSFETQYQSDFVKVYDEKNNIYTYSGSLSPFEKILGSSANVIFSSDLSFEFTGFLASFESVPTPSAEPQCMAENNFWCASSSKCISQIWVCDGDKDCGTNGEDEYGCPLSTIKSSWQCQGLGKFWCSRSSKCINQINRCDGRWDCSYQQDEEDCSQTTSSNEFLNPPHVRGAAITGAVIGSILGFSVFVVIIVFACRAVSARNTRTNMAARAVQHHNAAAIRSVPAAYPRQYSEGPTSQVYFAAPPPDDAAAKAYTAGWQVCDQLPTSNIPVTNTQSPSQVPGPSA